MIEKLADYSIVPEMATAKIQHLGDYNFRCGWTQKEDKVSLFMDAGPIPNLPTLPGMTSPSKASIGRWFTWRSDHESYDEMDAYYGILVEFLLTQTGYYTVKEEVVNPLNAD